MINPSEVKKAAEKVEAANLRFRTYLKRFTDSAILDERCRKLHEELFEGYDCSKCRNCCRRYAIDLDPLETERAAEYLNLSKEEFIKLFADSTADNRYKTHVTGPPCALLREDGRCLIEGAKPLNCQEFPFTGRPDMMTRLMGVIEYAQICPVAYEIIERLKDQYRGPYSKW